MKILFLIIAGGGPIHDQDETAQRKTWAIADTASIQVIWLRGHSENVYKFQDRTLFVPCVPSFESILEKTILGFNWVLENVEFDYLIRSNTSTYFQVNRVIKRIGKIEEGELGGTFETNRRRIPEFDKGYRYLNGSGLYMTRNSALALATLNPHFYSGLPDDLSIFKYMMSLGFRPIPIKRNNLDLHHFFYPYPQVRVKSWSSPELTVSRMFKVHAYFESKSNLLKIRSWLEVELNEIRYSRITLRNLKKVLTRVFNLMTKK